MTSEQGIFDNQVECSVWEFQAQTFPAKEARTFILIFFWQIKQCLKAVTHKCLREGPEDH